MRSKPQNDYVCAYTTNNEHDAQLVKIGLENEGITVFFQRNSDPGGPNSLIHRIELYVLKAEKEKSDKFLSKFKH